MGQYKTDTTSYVLKDIPVDTWKSIKGSLIKEDIQSANALLLFLLNEYIKGKTRKYGSK